MFDSLDSGYIPICLIVVAASWFISGVRQLWLLVLLTIAVPIAVSLSWGFLPRLPDLFRPLQFGEDDWVPWIFMAVFLWSAVSLPVGAFFVLLFSIRRKRSAHVQ